MPRKKRVNGKLYEQPNLLEEFASKFVDIFNKYSEKQVNKIEALKRITNRQLLKEFDEVSKMMDENEDKIDVVNQLEEEQGIHVVKGHNRNAYTRIKLPNTGDNLEYNREYIRKSTDIKYVSKLYGDAIRKVYDLDFNKFLQMEDEERIEYYKNNIQFCNDIFIISSLIDNADFTLNPKIRKDFECKKSMFEELIEGRAKYSAKAGYVDLIIPNREEYDTASFMMCKTEIDKEAGKLIGKADDFERANKQNNKYAKNETTAMKESFGYVFASAIDRSDSSVQLKTLASSNQIDKNFSKTKGFFIGDEQVSIATALSQGKKIEVKELPLSSKEKLQEGLTERLLISKQEYYKAFDEFTSKESINKLRQHLKDLTRTESRHDKDSKEYEEVKEAYNDLFQMVRSVKPKKTKDADKIELVDMFNSRIEKIKEKISLYEAKGIENSSSDKLYERSVDRLDIMAEMVNDLEDPITSLYNDKYDPSLEISNNKEPIDVEEVEEEIDLDNQILIPIRPHARELDDSIEEEKDSRVNDSRFFE